MSRTTVVFTTLFVILFGLVAALAAIGQNSAETLGAIYLVEYDDSAEIEPFLDFDIWQDRITEDAVHVRMTDAQLASVQNLPVDISLVPDMTEPLYLDYTDRGGDTIPNFACYRTVESTASDLAILAAQHPTLIDIIDIGDTYDKITAGGSAGYDLLAYKVTNELLTPAQPKPVFFVLAAVHAREYTTAETATRLIEHLVQNYGTDPDITWMLDYYELHIIPQGNPDGRKIAESVNISWRKNRNPAGCAGGGFGVDLNRNSAYQWGAPGASNNACSELYRGPFATSEPETAAFKSYADSILIDQRADTLTAVAPITTTGLFITIHSWFPGILPAWGFDDYGTNPNFTGMNAIGRKMGHFNKYRTFGTNAGIGGASGTHDDYVYGEFGLPSFTYEMGTSFHQSCSSFESTVYPDNLDALLWSFKSVRQPYAVATGPDLSAVEAVGNGSSGNAITVTQGTVVTLNATANDNLYHQDPWYASQTAFDATIDVQNIASVVATLDAPSWASPSATFTMNAVDGTFDQSAENTTVTIDTSSLSIGKHTFFVTATDSDGVAGVPSAVFVTVEAGGTPTKVYLPMITANAEPATRRERVNHGVVALGNIGLAVLTLRGRGKLGE